jgi:2-dehydropantoate 2-reductase
MQTTSRSPDGRIAMVGAGALGCYFGALLSRAKVPVSVIARGRHLEAIARDGIRVESPAGDFHVAPAQVTDDPAQVGPVDSVILAVKAWQVPAAAAAMRPLLAPGTRVLPLQNGVEAWDQLGETLGREVPLMGLCRVVSLLAAPGRVRHVAMTPMIGLGEPDGGPLSSRAQALAGALEAAGVTVERPSDMRAALWGKLLFIAALSGAGSVTRATVGEMRACAPTRFLLRDLMEEVAAVALARGIRLDEQVVDRTLAFVDSMPGTSTASMQRDIMEGKPSELEAIIGALIRIGREANVATPAASFVYASLLPQERAARGSGA